MKLDLKRPYSGFRFHLANRSLEIAIMKKLHLAYNPKFDSRAFAFSIEKMLNECRYVDAYKYIYDTLSAIDNKCTTNYRLWKYILQDNSEQAIRIINRAIKVLNCGMARDEALMFRYGILGGDYVETDCVKQNPYFANMLCGKRIAIIGPANDPDLDLETISKYHDVIVVLNYSQKGSIEQYKSNPNCKVVSYYSGGGLLKVLDLAGDDQTVFYEPDAIVLKEVWDDLRLNKDLYNSERIRLKLGLKWFLCYGSPNMIQIAAFDLIQFNPQSIDIYGCNFYLDKNRYREDYIGCNNGMEDSRVLIKCLAGHNQILQYQILFYLYKHKRINPDNMLRKILDLGIEDFCAEMERFLSTK